MALNPYLFFDGRCAEAIEFYQRTLGAEVVSMMRYKDAPPGEGGMPPGQEDKVMHASLRVQGSDIMASDGGAGPGPVPAMAGFALCIDAKSADEGRKLFDALAAGGQVTMPYGPTFWSSGFGMLTDAFGVPWMVNVDH